MVSQKSAVLIYFAGKPEIAQQVELYQKQIVPDFVSPVFNYFCPWVQLLSSDLLRNWWQEYWTRAVTGLQLWVDNRHCEESLILSELPDRHFSTKVKESCNRAGVAQRVTGGLGSQISWHSPRECGKLVSLTHRPPLPAGMYLVLIFTRGWVDTRNMVRSEGNMSLKNPVTPLGIDPGTVRLVAQSLNHYATLGPALQYAKPNIQWVQKALFLR